MRTVRIAAVQSAVQILMTSLGVAEKRVYFDKFTTTGAAEDG